MKADECVPTQEQKGLGFKGWPFVGPAALPEAPIEVHSQWPSLERVVAACLVPLFL